MEVNQGSVATTRGSGAGGNGDAIDGGRELQDCETNGPVDQEEAIELQVLETEESPTHDGTNNGNILEAPADNNFSRIMIVTEDHVARSAATTENDDDDDTTEKDASGAAFEEGIGGFVLQDAQVAVAAAEAVAKVDDLKDLSTDAVASASRTTTTTTTTAPAMTKEEAAAHVLQVQQQQISPEEEPKKLLSLKQAPAPPPLPLSTEPESGSIRTPLGHFGIAVTTTSTTGSQPVTVDDPVVTDSNHHSRKNEALFVNEGLQNWEAARRAWLGLDRRKPGEGPRPCAVSLDVDEIIDIIFLSSARAATAAQNGSSSSSTSVPPQRFPQNVALPQMVDILQDLWEAEGLDA